jgi:hypothetical protein
MSEIVTLLSTVLLTVLAGLAKLALTKFTEYTEEQVKAAKMQAFNTRLLKILPTAVAYVSQTLVDSWRGVSGVKLTSEQRQEALKRAVEASRGLLGQRFIDEIEELYGKGFVDINIEMGIEAAVRQAKTKEGRPLIPTAELVVFPESEGQTAPQTPTPQSGDPLPAATPAPSSDPK